MRRALRLALQRADDYRFDAFILDRAEFLAAERLSTLDPLGNKAATPLANRHRMHANLLADILVLLADILVLQPLGTRQNGRTCPAGRRFDTPHIPSRTPQGSSPTPGKYCGLLIYRKFTRPRQILTASCSSQ